MIKTYFFITLLVFCQRGLAQMPVEDEPHHKVLFENKLIRLIDLVVLPSDTTVMHKHSAASVVVFLSNSSFAIQNESQSPVITNVKPGDVVYRNYDEKPVIHKVWSADQSTFHCLVVEMKSTPSSRCNSLPMTESRLLFQQKQVNAYHLRFHDSGIHCIIPATCPYLLINFSHAANITFSGKVFEQGGYAFIPADGKVEVNSGQKAEAVLLQFSIGRHQELIK